MRRLLLALLLICSPAFAAEPKAVISGPTTATVGQSVLLDVGGSSTDADFPLQVEVAGEGEFRPTLRLWYDAAGKPGLAVLTAPRPGNYTVVVVAIGKPEGAQLNVTRIAAWPIAVDPIAPPPKPDPEPGPKPPDPEPGPSPVAGKLWGVLILPDLPSPSEAALRTDAEVRKAFAEVNTTFRSYLASEQEVQGAGYKASITSAGGAPAVVWIAEGGKVVKTTAKASKDAILADLKALRGGK